MQAHLSHNPTTVSRDKTLIEVNFETGDGQQPRVIHLKAPGLSKEVQIQSQDTDWAQRAVPYSPLND